MKTLKFLFFSLIMVAFLAPNVANAQALKTVVPDEFKVNYVVDGEPVEALVVGEWSVVTTPIKEFDDMVRIHIVRIFRGEIVDDVPLPEKALMVDVFNKVPILYATMLITPNGEVKSL